MKSWSSTDLGSGLLYPDLPLTKEGLPRWECQVTDDAQLSYFGESPEPRSQPCPRTAPISRPADMG